MWVLEGACPKVGRFECSYAIFCSYRMLINLGVRHSIIFRTTVRMLIRICWIDNYPNSLLVITPTACPITITITITMCSKLSSDSVDFIQPKNTINSVHLHDLLPSLISVRWRAITPKFQSQLFLTCAVFNHLQDFRFQIFPYL